MLKVLTLKAIHTRSSRSKPCPQHKVVEIAEASLAENKSVVVGYLSLKPSIAALSPPVDVILSRIGA